MSDNVLGPILIVFLLVILFTALGCNGFNSWEGKGLRIKVDDKIHTILIAPRKE